MSFSQALLCWKEPRPWEGRNVVLIPGVKPKFSHKRQEKVAFEKQEHIVAEPSAKKSLLSRVRVFFTGKKAWSGRHAVLLPGEPPRFSHERPSGRKDKCIKFFQSLKGRFNRRKNNKVNVLPDDNTVIVCMTEVSSLVDVIAANQSITLDLDWTDALGQLFNARRERVRDTIDVNWTGALWRMFSEHRHAKDTPHDYELSISLSALFGDASVQHIGNNSLSYDFPPISQSAIVSYSDSELLIQRLNEARNVALNPTGILKSAASDTGPKPEKSVSFLDCNIYWSYKQCDNELNYVQPRSVRSKIPVVRTHVSRSVESESPTKYRAGAVVSTQYGAPVSSGLSRVDIF